MIEIKSNVGDVRKGLAGLIQQQLPFAISKAVNTAAYGARDVMRKHTAETMTIRRPWVLGGYRVQPSNKRQDPIRAVLYLDPARDFLGKHEAGGNITSRTGRQLVVPLAARPNEQALVPKRLSVRNLGLTAHRTKTGKVQLKGKLGTFVVKTPTRSLIMQRKRGGDVVALHVFKRSVYVRPVLRFGEIVPTYVRENWQSIAGAALREAIRSAR